MRIFIFLSSCFLLLASCSLLLIPNACANNLSISGVTLANKNTGTQTWDIQLNVSWDNSWCDSGDPCNGDASTQTANHDAVWLFAKFSVWNSTTKTWGDWTQANLSTTNGGLTPPAGSRIDVGCTRPGTSSVDCTQADATGMGVFFISRRGQLRLHLQCVRGANLLGIWQQRRA